MIKTFNTKLLLWICFILSLAVFTACEKEDKGSDAVELLSFGPAGALHGDTLFIIGNNLDRVTSVQLVGATVAQTEFKKQTGEEIQLVIPVAAEPGNITLVTPAGNVVSRSRLNLEVGIEVATVTDESRPGENITLTGNYLNWVTSVIFPDNLVVDSADFVSQSITQLVVPVPMEAKSGTLFLSYGGTKPMTVETDTELKVTLPMATAMAPNPIKHQSNLTITGTNLDLVREVKFTGVSTGLTQFESQSATQIVVKVPAAAQKGKITFVAPSGLTTQTATDLEMVMPVSTNITPKPVDPEGELTITGTNLDLVTAIKFPEVTAAVTTFISQSPTQIKVRVPAGAAKGKLTFSVLNSTLTTQSAQEIEISGGPAEIPFKAMVFGDGFDANWEAWGGWGTASQDFNNGEQVKSGNKAIKVVYSSTDGYGAVQLHPKTTFPVPGAYSTMRLSIYAGTNATASSRIAVYLKDATDPSDGQKVKLTLVPGKYTTYEIPLSAFTNNPAKINEFVIQNYGTTGLTIFIDEIGFY